MTGAPAAAMHECDRVFRYCLRYGQYEDDGRAISMTIKVPRTACSRQLGAEGASESSSLGHCTLDTQRGMDEVRLS
jgi:hypothetical protein